MLKRAAAYGLKKLWQTTAIVLVTIAVITSLLRVALPYADGYRVEIEQWVAENYNVDVSIGQLSAGWERFGPAFIIQDVTFSLDAEDNTSLQLDEVRMELDFWGSILSRAFVARNVILNGVDLAIDETLLFSQESKQDPDHPLADVLSQVFLEQLQQFSLENSRFKINTQYDDDPVFYIGKMQWINSGQHHQGFGSVHFGDSGSRQVDVILDLFGEEREEMFGQLYLAAEKLDTTAWMSNYIPSYMKVNTGSVSFRAWAFIDQGVLKKKQIEIDEVQANLAVKGQLHEFNIDQGQLLLTPVGDGWSLEGSQVRVQHNQQSWPDLNFMLNYQQHLNAFIDEVSLSALSDLALMLPQLENEHELLTQLQLSGAVKNIKLHHDENAVPELNMQLESISFQQYGEIPGFTVDTGLVYLHGERGHIQLNTERQLLDYPQLFADPMVVEALSASASFYSDANGWHVLSDDLLMRTSDLQLDAELRIESVDGVAGMLLAANVGNVDVSQAYKYYPPEYMDKDLSDYLSGALISGQVNRARVVWQGDFANFPYPQHDGVFQAYADLEQVEFNFDDAWLNLQDTDMQLQFENNGMAIDVKKATLGGIEVEGLQAEIPTFAGEPWLYLSADILDDHTRDVFYVMDNSPLQDTVAATLEYMNLRGSVNGDFSLDIPLGNEGEVRAQGRIDLKETQARLPEPEILLTNMQGVLAFDNEVITVKALQADLNGVRSNLDIGTKNNDKGQYQLDIDVQADSTAEQIFAHYPSKLDQRISGPVSMLSKVQVILPDDGFNVSVESSLDLTQTSLALPAPFNKLEGQAANMQVQVEVDDAHLFLRIGLDDKFHFQAYKASEEVSISQALLQITNGNIQPMSLPESGFSINADLDFADFMSWYDFVENHIISDIDLSNDEPAMLSAPDAIEARVDALSVFGSLVKNANMQVKQDGDWHLIIDAENLKGAIDFSQDWFGKGIDANISYADLFGDYEKDEDLQPLGPSEFFAGFPSIRLACEQCTLFNYNLGQLQADIVRHDDRLEFRQLIAEDDNSTMTATGSWSVVDDIGINQLSANIEAKDAGIFLQKFDLNTSLQDSRTTASFDLNWHGLPFVMDIPTLNGSLSTRFGYGHVTDVSDSGTRIFSILSLDSIVRKLRLDFRDVFSEGFFYNSITSDMTLNNGVASTDNTFVNGIPGDMTIKGYTNLVSGELNYSLEFAPKLTSSVPVILGWLVNPVVGLGAFALDKTLQSAQVISLVEFELTGTVNDPKIEEVGRSSKKVPLPQVVVPVVEIDAMDLIPTESLQGIELPIEVDEVQGG